MKSSYDDKLNCIIDQYGYHAESLPDSTMIHNMILELLFTRCPHKKIAIWGVGKSNTVNSHAAVIITKYALELTGLTHLIDSSKDIQGTIFMGYPVISPEEIEKEGIQLVIIASRASGDSIKRNLQEVAPQCEYIDIYEELRRQGVVIDYNFFSEQNIYTRLYQLKQTYESTDALQNKQQVLHELIARYLEIRDFTYAFAFAEQYIEHQYADAPLLDRMLQEIRAVLLELKNKNHKRKDDIMIHLIDSLRAIDVYDVPTDKKEVVSLKLLKAYEAHASIFTQAYATGPTTYESMLGMIKQKLSFEENVYEGSNFLFHFKDFALLKDVVQSGRKITFYTAKDYYIMREDSGVEVKEQLHMSEKLWHVACDMAESEQSTFNFLYYPWELHFPMLCGFHRKQPIIKSFSDVGLEDMSGYIEEQFEDCKAYVDKQLTYYKDFFSDEMITVFMGDHSQPVYDAEEHKPFFMYYREPDKVSHVAFMIHSSKITRRVNTELVSMLDFNAIMQQIIYHMAVNIPKREVVQYQYYNIQNKKLREAAKKAGYMDYTEGISCFLSQDWLYVITGTGIKELFKRSDIQNRKFCNRADSDIGQEIIEKIEKNFDTSFPSFWTIRKEV